MKENNIIKHIVGWIADYSNNSHTDGFVVGISGGVDSALVSFLLAETKKKVLCISLPIHQNKEHLIRVKELMKSLEKYKNVSFLEKDLSDILDLFKNNNNINISDKGLLELAEANLRSRLRMLTLYYYAGLNNFLVVGTGNKIEDFGIGFFTKYGDGGVDISPIADLMKSEVYILSKKLGVPKSILECKPTDGLFGDDKSDEQQIGASYDELEWAMNYTSMSDDNLTDRQKEVLNIFRYRNIKNRHKVIPIPFCKIPLEYKN